MSICEKCKVFNVPEELYMLTKRNKCLRCTIKGYKFMLFRLQKDIEDLTRKYKELESEKKSVVVLRKKKED